MFTNAHTHHSSNASFEIVQEKLNRAPMYGHSVGIHPWDSDKYTPDAAVELIEFSINNYTWAIGECGLDALKGPDFSVQIPVFEAQIELSEGLGLPLIIHCVKGWNEVARLRKKFQPSQAWIFHGFAKFGILENVLESGMMVSLGGAIIDHPKAQEIVSMIPDTQLLLETDDREMEIKQVYEYVAGLKKISLQQLNECVTTNFKNTFRKWQIG